MTGSERAGDGGVEPVAPAPWVDPFLDARLHHPPPRPEWIHRERLLDAMDRAVRHPLSLVSAPVGYGKTTLVAQWLASDRAPTAAWVALDAGDNEPRRLWAHVIMALERIGCFVSDDLDALLRAHGHEVNDVVLPRIVNALATFPRDVVILLDDFHYLHEPACHDQVELLVDNLPDQAHLVIVTRADPGLRLARLRASGRLVEIRADDLTFRADEAAALLAVGDVHLSSDGVAQLMERTEGWPAGLYLAALSLAGRDDPDSLVQEFKGGSRFVGDYLTEEVLNRHPDSTREFITSMSVLDRFSASLCDHVADRTGSAALLNELERTNMFLIPLDQDRRWYRFHHLFAAVARAELEVEDPARIPVLHARAAEWFRARGHIDEAVSHAVASGSVTDAAELVAAHWLSYLDAGRAETVLGWLAELGDTPGDLGPAAEVTAAWMAALTGDEGALSEHVLSLDGFRRHGPLPDGTASVESAIALIQGLFGYGGPVQMTAGAERALELETNPWSPYFAIAHLGRAHAAFVEGELDLAADHFARASQTDAAPAIVRVLSLSGHSLVEHERGHLHRSRDLAELAMRLVQNKGLGSMPQASLAFTALGQAQAAAGQTTQGMATLRTGLAMRRSNPDIGPWGTIHHLLVAGRVCGESGALAEGQEQLAEAAERMARYDDGMDAMWARFAGVEAALRAMPVDGGPLEALTGRELDVLRLLPTPLSLGEISAALHLSANTVKTHAQAVYRKLGAHSRSEAVAIGRLHQLI